MDTFFLFHLLDCIWISQLEDLKKVNLEAPDNRDILSSKSHSDPGEREGPGLSWDYECTVSCSPREFLRLVCWRQVQDWPQI